MNSLTSSILLVLLSKPHKKTLSVLSRRGLVLEGYYELVANLTIDQCFCKSDSKDNDDATQLPCSILQDQGSGLKA